MGRARRQEIYQRIRESSKNEVIRQEMLRLGFWRPEDGEAKLTDDWLERRSDLTKEIRKLAAKQKKFDDQQAILRAARKKRMAESRARREETKERREREREERANAWVKRKEEDIVYLGEGVSAGLHGEQESDTPALARSGAPAAATIAELATLLDTSVGELRWLSFHRAVSETTHYRRFLLPKKTGGHRLISAPMPRLKTAQYAVLERILNAVPVHAAAHGFAPGRSILSNAQPHVGKDVVINMDVKDFFPTVTYPRVKGVFRALGYPERIATVLGLLCTEPDADEVELDGRRLFVHKSERHLPQGAPTSPAITNILCYRLDRRLQGMADSLGYTYTRYADDMTFSASGAPAGEVKKLLWRAQSIVGDEGFALHPDKTRIMRRGRRQEVTGLTVNERVSVPRADLRRFRALLHQVERDGPEGKTWRGSGRHLLAALRGYAYFIRMVDEERGAPIVEKAEAILGAQGWHHEVRHLPKAAREAAEAGEKGTGLIGRLVSWVRGRGKKEK